MAITRLGLYGGPRAAYPGFATVASVAVTGTASGGLTETQVVTGGETIILTLTNSTWLAAGATFDAQRQNIIDGLDSDGAEGTGWNTVIRDAMDVSAVVRTSDTVVTITLPAAPTYNITANETVTVTVPSSAHSEGSEMVGDLTILVTADATVSAGGHFMPGLAGVRAGRRRSTEAAREAVEEIIDEAIAEVLEDEKPPEARIQRVSRRRRSEIIDLAARQITETGALLGEVRAIARVVDILSRDRIAARRERLQADLEARQAAETEAAALAEAQRKTAAENDLAAVAVLLLLMDD